jgi:hypothetical protein
VRSRLLLAVAAAVAATALLIERVVTWARAEPTWFDDAYMFVRYADAWRHGHGLRWNPDEPPIYGATGMVHLVIVTALRAVSVGDTRAIMSASTGAAVLALILLSLLTARFASHAWLRAHPERAALLVIPLVAYSEAFGFHATTGMDTMSSLCANAALAMAVLFLVEKPTPRAALACAIVGWLAVEARPDNAIVAVLGPLLAILLVAPRRAVAFLVPFALLVGASLTAKKLYFGTALPLSFWAKRPRFYPGHAGEYTWNPFWFLAVFLRAAAPTLCVLVLCAKRRHARQLIVLLAPTAMTVALLFGMNQIMGHLGRFYFPLLAWPVAAAAIASDGAAELHLRSLGVRVAIAAALLVGGAVSLDAAGKLYESRAAAQPLADLGGYHVDAKEPLPERDSWQSSIEMAELAAAAPPGTRFAMTEHGLVAARAPDAIVLDMLGLHDREVALHGFSAEKLLDRAPDLIWMPHPDYTQMIRDILDEPRFFAGWDFYPDALTFGVALRRGGPPSLRERFEARFHTDYPGARLEDYRAHADSHR